VCNVFGQLAAAVSLQLAQQDAPPTAEQALRLGVAVALGVAGGALVQDAASQACRGKGATPAGSHLAEDEHGAPILGSSTYGHLPALSTLPVGAPSLRSPPWTRHRWWLL
jgi:hypothetical protein